MNRRMNLRIIGLALIVEAALLLLPVFVGLLYGERPVAFQVSQALS